MSKTTLGPLDVLKPAVRLAKCWSPHGNSSYEIPIEQGTITGVSVGGEFVRLQTTWFFGLLNHEEWLPAAAVRLIDTTAIPPAKKEPATAISSPFLKSFVDSFCDTMGDGH